MRIKLGNVEYYYHEDIHYLGSVKIYGIELKDHMFSLLHDTKISTPRPFTRFPHEIVFFQKLGKYV